MAQARQQQFLEEIKNLFALRRIDEVINRTNELLKHHYLDPDFKRKIWLLRGEAFDRKQNHDAAILAYLEAEKLDGRELITTSARSTAKIATPERNEKNESDKSQLTADDLYKLAKNEHDQKKYNEAIELVSQALILNPRLEDAILLQSHAEHALNNYKEVITIVTRGIALCGSKLGAFYARRSFAYVLLGDKVKASDDAEKAIQHGQDNNGVLYAHLAFKKLHDKDYQDAVEAATNSIKQKQDPTAHAFLYRAQAKFALQDFDGALADALQCTKLKNDDFWDIKDDFKAQASFKNQALNLITDIYKKLIKPKDALKSAVAAVDFCKTVEPVPLKTLCKFFIFQQHGKVMASAPSHFGRSAEQLCTTPSNTIGSQFGRLREVLADQDITQETIFMMRDLQDLPVGAPDLFDALNIEEERRLKLEMYRQSM